MNDEDNPHEKIKKLKNKLIEITVYNLDDTKHKRFLADNLEKENFDLDYPKYLISQAKLNETEKLELFKSLLKDLKRIKENENPDFEYYLNDGRYFAETVYELGDFELAIDWYEFLVQLYDLDINLLGLARCYINLERVNEGIGTLLEYLIKSVEIYGEHENNSPQEISHAKQTIYSIITYILNKKMEEANKIIQNEFIRKEKEKNAAKVMQLITDINDICNKKGTGCIFKMTDKIVKEHSILRSDIEDNQSFERLIDFFYYLLYESTGGKTSRLSEKGIQNYSTINEIKTLRNLQFRHDINHGNPKDIKKKHIEIGNILKKYVNKSSLSQFNKEDYRKMSQQLVLDVLSLLDNLKMRL